jgi:hypothetical protein
MTEDPMDEDKPLGTGLNTDQEMADYDLGFAEGKDGKPNDDTKSIAWQSGWEDAQK